LKVGWYAKTKMGLWLCVRWKIKFKKRGGRGLEVISREGLKVNNWRLKVRGQKSRIIDQNEKSVHWRLIKYFRSKAILQSDSLVSGVQPITCFDFALSSNQIPRYWECSQSRVSSMGIQPLGLHESGNWGNQAFSRSSSRPIRFSKGEKSEFTGHFSKFVIVGITLGKDCLKKMLIVYKAWPKVSEGRQFKLTGHLSTFIKFQEVLLEKKQLEFDSDIS
jgi:hypothetical protein